MRPPSDTPLSQDEAAPRPAAAVRPGPNKTLTGPGTHKRFAP